MLTLEKFEEASELVKKVTNPTKLVYSQYLSEQTGGKIYLKPENMQCTGAYKVRGAYYKICTLTEEEREKGGREEKKKEGKRKEEKKKKGKEKRKKKGEKRKRRKKKRKRAVCSTSSLIM